MYSRTETKKCSAIQFQFQNSLKEMMLYLIKYKIGTWVVFSFVHDYVNAETF